MLEGILWLLGVMVSLALAWLDSYVYITNIPNKIGLFRLLLETLCRRFSHGPLPLEGNLSCLKDRCVLARYWRWRASGTRCK